MRFLGINHTSYFITTSDFNKDIHCLGDSFCSKNIEFIPAHYCIMNYSYEDFLDKVKVEDF